MLGANATLGKNELTVTTLVLLPLGALLIHILAIFQNQSVRILLAILSLAIEEL